MLRIGTSGFGYEGWRGRFYPADLPAGEMLSYYARHFNAVEINSTFYGLPRPDVFETWARQVPPTFRFTLKAPRRITHEGRLKQVEDETAQFMQRAALLGQRLGAVLFQLPPSFTEDLPTLEAFLDGLPREIPVAVEFRHASWFEVSVAKSLQARDCALCVTDSEDTGPALVATAQRGYLRLRRDGYSDAVLAEWARRIREQAWLETYVFFKHDEQGEAAGLAARFQETARESAGE